MGNGEFRKAREKKRGSRAPPALLLRSIRSRFCFSRPLCRRSPSSRSLEQASKTLKKTNQARVVRSCFMAALLPRI